MFANQGTQKPIKVLENNTHFLVEIAASQKERASRIAGRRWDAQLVSWIYPKTIECYEALKAEFERDADKFKIRKPKRKSLPEAVRTSQSQDDNDFENEWKEMSEKTSSIENSFADVSSKVDYLVKTIQGLEETSNSLENMILAQRLESTIEEESGAAENTISDKSLNDKLEEFLIDIAVASTGNDQSFILHMEKYNPLSKSEQFVMRTHERLLQSIAQMCGDSSPRESSFSDYVNQLKNCYLVEDTREKKIIATLFMLNSHRNQIVHSRNIPDQELKNRAITYLMGVAFIWCEVASEQVED